MKNFEQLKIWQKGFDDAVNTFKFTAAFPPEQKFRLGLQITKTAVSILSNIAEGSNRSSKKNYNRFLDISPGSAFELDTQIQIAKAVNFRKSELTEILLKEIDEEQKLLMSF